MPGLWTTAAGVIILIAIVVRVLISIANREAREFQVRRWTVGTSTEKLRIGHVSDLHYDPVRGTLPEEVLEKAVAELSSSQLDVIFATGDYINDDPKPSKALAERYLAPLQHATPLGVYATLGNHEYKRKNGREVVTKNLTGVGIKMLVNDSVRVGGALVVGLDDVTGTDWGGARAAVEVGVKKAIDDGLEKVVILSHNPSTAKMIVKWVEKYPTPRPHVLILSGHTHGGQICTPSGRPVLGYLRRVFDYLHITYTKIRLTPFRLAFTVRNWTHVEGLHHLTPEITLIVSRGLGSHLEARLNCPTDIGVVEF